MEIVIMLLILIIVALLGVACILWPRKFARALRSFGTMDKSPIRDWEIPRTRIVGIVIVVGCALELLEVILSLVR
jgi:hypothetical protein